MHVSKGVIVSLMLGLTATMTGCTSTQSTQVAVRSIVASSQCGFSDELLKVVATQTDIPKRLQATLQPTQLGESSKSNQSEHEIEAAVAEHTNTKEQLVLATIGQRANPGYQLQLTGAQATIKQGVLTLPLEVTQPDPNKFYAQVIVTPCVLLAVETEQEIVELRYQ